MLQQSVKEDPDFSASWFMLGSELKKQSREKEALKAFHRSIDILPDNYLSMVQLAKLHLVSRNPEIKDLEKAYYFARKANEITYYQKAYLLQNLARVLSEKDQMEKAIEMAELGIQRAREKKNHTRAEIIENELRAYRQGMNFLSIITRKKAL
jgi:cytochrome c-type biogenesis protein CcmH/NrfG